MTTTKEALEPCPFGPPPEHLPPVVKEVRGAEGTYWWVGCEIHLSPSKPPQGCGVGHSALTKEEAIRKWNSRSAPIVAPVVDWQPAETAPKETEILMAWEDGHLQIVYLEDKPSFWFENEPTHWAPLPAGPSAAPASPAAIRDEVEMSPSVKTGIDSIARHIARPVRGCATDEQYTDVVQRATDALTAAAETLARKNTPSSTLARKAAERAAAEIAFRINGGENEDLSYPKPLNDLLDDPSIANEAAFRDWLAAIIERCFSAEQAK